LSLAVPDPDHAFGGRLDRLPALSAGWEYTAGRLSEISTALNEAFTEEASRAVAVFLAGSYGRLEAGPASDADLMVVYDDDVSPRVYLGLLLPIMNASRDEHRKRKREYIEGVLTLPPAARITGVLDEVDRGNVAAEPGSINRSPIAPDWRGRGHCGDREFHRSPSATSGRIGPMNEVS